MKRPPASWPQDHARAYGQPSSPCLLSLMWLDACQAGQNIARRQSGKLPTMHENVRCNPCTRITHPQPHCVLLGLSGPTHTQLGVARHVNSTRTQTAHTDSIRFPQRRVASHPLLDAMSARSHSTSCWAPGLRSGSICVHATNSLRATAGQRVGSVMALALGLGPTCTTRQPAAWGHKHRGAARGVCSVHA